MNYLKEIVDEINQELKNSDKMQWTSGIAHSLYYNIAKLVERTGVKGLEDGRYPVVEDQDGTLDWIARNGKFSMQIYHRLIRTVPADGSKNFKKAPKVGITEGSEQEDVMVHRKEGGPPKWEGGQSETGH